ETAKLPNLSQLATEAACGLIRHVAPGVTPGSGPGHLGLFGYDPLQYQVGRGVLEALGIEFDLRAGDVAARGNFCTVDSAGLITDRRAGRIKTEASVRLGGRRETPPPPHRAARRGESARGRGGAWSMGSKRSGGPASKCGSSRSRSTASCWS